MLQSTEIKKYPENSHPIMSNVQDYTLTNRKPKEPVYALIIISNVHLTGGQGGDDSHMTYMIDKVGMIPKMTYGCGDLRRIPVKSLG